MQRGNIQKLRSFVVRLRKDGQRRFMRGGLRGSNVMKLLSTFPTVSYSNIIHMNPHLYHTRRHQQYPCASTFVPHTKTTTAFLYMNIFNTQMYEQLTHTSTSVPYRNISHTNTATAFISIYVGITHECTNGMHTHPRPYNAHIDVCG